MRFSFFRKPRATSGRTIRKKARSRAEQESGPPITPAESRANLSDLQRDLNRAMKCHAGRNQVFIGSLLTGTGTTRPRITLKCHLRKDIGLRPTVFYGHIRDVCCADPDKCEAYRQFGERFVQT